MSIITYSKSFTINGKVLRYDDIVRIAMLLHDQAQPDDYEEEYEIIFNDQSRIKGERTIDVFRSDEFKRRRSVYIQLTYASRGYEKSVRVTLYDSSVYQSRSTVEISSTDKAWYNRICNEMTTIISEMEGQKLQFVHDLKYLIVILFVLIEWILLSYLLKRFFPGFTGVLVDFVGFLGIAILGLMNLWFVESVADAYPKFEFAFGPTYLNRSRGIRKSLGIFVPILIEVILVLVGL